MLYRYVAFARDDNNINIHPLKMAEAKEWSRETSKLMQLFQAAIEESALQVYSSAIAFAPPTSRIFCHYHDIIPIPRVLPGAWSTHSQSIILGGHNGVVLCLSFSSNGRMIASGSNDRTVRLWDVQTGAAVGVPLVGHSTAITCLAFSPDGERIASASSDGILLWDPTAGTPIIKLLETKDEATCLCFSLNGQWLYSGSSNIIQVWDAKTGAAVREHTLQHTNVIVCLSFSPDGLRVATASSNNTIQLWNTETGVVVGTPLVGHTSSIQRLSFSLDGQRIASASEDSTIQLWNTETGAAVGDPLLGHTNWIRCLSFSPNGQILASGSFDSTIRLWNAKTGVVVGKPLNRKAPVECLSFSLDGKIIASGGQDDAIHLSESGTGAAVGEQPEEHTGAIFAMSFSPDGRKVVSGSYDMTIRVWDAETGSAIGAPIQCDYYPRTFQLHLLNSELLLLVNDSNIYNLSSEPPVLCPPTKLPEPEAAMSPIEYKVPWTYVKATTVTRFRLPSTFSSRRFSIHESKIAYGGWDGTVIIVDCTHLL
jgi:WD40 repeat protein